MNSDWKKFYTYLEKHKKVSCPESDKGRQTFVIPANKPQIFTDLKTRKGYGCRLVICHSQIPIYAKKYAENQDYFIDNNVREIEIVKDSTYYAMHMKEHRRLETVRAAVYLNNPFDPMVII